MNVLEYLNTISTNQFTAIGAQKLQGFKLQLDDSEFDTSEFIPNKTVGIGAGITYSLALKLCYPMFYYLLV